MQKTFGLVGYPLEHSYSKDYFTKKFIQLGLCDYRYLNLEIQNLDDLKDLIKKNNVIGFNVTLPHKVNILRYLDTISAEAEAVGAVNTVKVEYRGDKIILHGFNTDIHGFAQSLKPFLEMHHHKALVLGNGGASRAVQFVLKNLGIDFLTVTRNPLAPNQVHYSQINNLAVQFHPLIINTTTLGMFPYVDTFPDIPYHGISEKHLAIDLIYNPPVTKFLQKAEKQGAKILNGLSMLHLQAEKAWEIWNN